MWAPALVKCLEASQLKWKCCSGVHVKVRPFWEASLTKEGSKGSFSGHWRPNRSSFAKLFPLSTEKGIMGRLGINTPAECLKLCQMNIIIKNLQKCDTETWTNDNLAELLQYGNKHIMIMHYKVTFHSYSHQNEPKTDMIFTKQRKAVWTIHPHHLWISQ